MKRLFFTVLSALFLIGTGSVCAEDGSTLWLRHAENSVRANVSGVKCTAATELEHYWHGANVVLKRKKGLPAEGYTITTGSDGTVTITASTDSGLLYGAYYLLRLQQSGCDMIGVSINDSPFYSLRILNHWDNPDGTVERGFAGRSIFLNPDPERLTTYARANASIGINGTVLNNVNAKPQALSEPSIRKAAEIADILRPYGIRVYLSVNFASPMKLGGLDTADPLAPEVVKWWREKVDQIYKSIPDFGGFLVKANSEGEPGPCDFGRSHADGANMLADVLRKHKGIVMWRAFVYNPQSADRASQAYEEFMPLDGQFRDNVIIQIKNGPVDFQPREPYSPLFTSLQHTSMMVEVQVTQEYLGASNHLVYLAPMWSEFFGLVKPQSLRAMAGVANIGDDVNWCGHHFAQANWYAFGRLAWNPSLTSDVIADEWLRQTFTTDDAFVSTAKQMMLDSHEAAVSYMMPLGLHHIFANEHHYGPEPWYHNPGMRADWTPPYYHRADNVGLGFDRTPSGSNNVSQYPDSLCRLYSDINTCPENLIAWFHHVPWNHRMHNGETFWQSLCHKYDEGLCQARRFLAAWDSLEQCVDTERFSHVQRRLRIQVRDAEWWRDACLLYFQTFSHMPIPQDMEHPVHNLDEMMQYSIPITIYENPPYGYTR